MKQPTSFLGQCLLPIVVGLIMFGIMVFIGSCGEDKDEPVPAPAPKASPVRDAAFTAIYPIIRANCTPCHDGIKHPVKFETPEQFKGSKARARITNGSMPPSPKKMTADSKGKLLEYLQ